MLVARRALFLLGLGSLATYAFALLGGGIFYAALGAEQMSHGHGLSAGLAIIGIFMGGVLGIGAMFTAGLFAMTLRRWPLARLLSPLPALAGTLGWGAWLWAGDPGDEPWLRIAAALSSACFAVSVASGVVGFPPAEVPAEP